MTLTQLGYIVAVAHHKSFGQAAKHCHVTQPTLSMQIQKLEDTLGVLIFDRSRQPVALTTIGSLLVDQARVVIREADRLQEIIRTENGQIQGEFRLGIIPTVAPYLLPLFLQKFVSKYPLVTLIVEELETAHLISRLKTDTLDAGILATPLHEEKIIEAKLFDEPFLVCMPHDHALAEKKVITESDLPLDKILLLNEGNCLRDQMISLCQFKAKNAGSNERLHFESGSLLTLIRLVEQGSGFTIVPYLAAETISPDKTVLKPFREPVPVREVSLVVRRSYVKHSILECLHKEIMLHLPKALLDLQKSKHKIVEFKWR